jgi:hypothetical protein
MKSYISSAPLPSLVFAHPVLAQRALNGELRHQYAPLAQPRHLPIDACRQRHGDHAQVDVVEVDGGGLFLTRFLLALLLRFLLERARLRQQRVRDVLAQYDRHHAHAHRERQLVLQVVGHGVVVAIGQKIQHLAVGIPRRRHITELWVRDGVNVARLGVIDLDDVRALVGSEAVRQPASARRPGECP